MQTDVDSSMGQITTISYVVFDILRTIHRDVFL